MSDDLMENREVQKELANRMGPIGTDMANALFDGIGGMVTDAKFDQELSRMTLETVKEEIHRGELVKKNPNGIISNINKGKQQMHSQIGMKRQSIPTGHIKKNDRSSEMEF